jgi:hypothetical protein
MAKFKYISALSTNIKLVYKIILETLIAVK